MVKLIWVWRVLNCYFLTEKEAIDFIEEYKRDLLEDPNSYVHKELMDSTNFNILPEWQGV